MSQQLPRLAAAAAPAKHRRTSGFGGTSLSALRAPGRGLLLAGGAVALVLLLALGYLLLNTGDDTESPPSAGGVPAPPLATPSAEAPSAGTPPSETPSAGASPSAPAGEAPPSSGPAGTPPSTGPPAEPAPDRPPPTERATPPPERTTPPPRRDPRLVGPKSADGFEKLLGAFCKKQGFRTALLLEGPDGSRRTGDWVCVQAITFDRLNLDEACRASFGERAKARRLAARDSTTWRCFDS